MTEELTDQATLTEQPPVDAPEGDTASATAPEVAVGRFPVHVEGFDGSLEQLVVRAQRGEIDLAAIPVADITAAYRRRIPIDADPAQLRDLADFMALAARLVQLKAQALMPTEGSAEAEEEEAIDGTDAGRRLAEYRLYKAAAEALLAEPAEEGAKSFLALVTPEVVAVERLRIPPERLAAAFRAVLERLQESEPPTIETVTYSVEEMTAALRHRLQGQRTLHFDEVFEAVVSRLQAVAVFLALLELLRAGEASVSQEGPLAPIVVTLNA